MTLAAYRATEHFAYPGWRLTVPGGPAGGHYKGFTHTQAAGTDIPPQDQYEQDREDGMSSHDPVHASPRNPRGVYRSSGEVPPRPNASGAAMTYRGYQTQRHAGTSVAPGSFPAPFEETDEDAFLARYAEHQNLLEGLGLVRPLVDDGGISLYEGDAPPQWVPPMRPNVCPTWGCGQPPIRVIDTGTGATSVVAQPPPTPLPLPPSPSVPVYVAPPVSPAPAPTVPTNEVVPDGRGNYINVSTGQTVPASAVEQNAATGQLTASSSLAWLEEHSIFSALPNWGVIAAGLLAASMLLGKHR